MLFQMLNAANRDPEHFDQPDAFIIDREPNKHVGLVLVPISVLALRCLAVEGEIASRHLSAVSPRLLGRPGFSLGYFKG